MVRCAGRIIESRSMWSISVKSQNVCWRSTAGQASILKQRALKGQHPIARVADSARRAAPRRNFFRFPPLRRGREQGEPGQPNVARAQPR